MTGQQSEKPLYLTQSLLSEAVFAILRLSEWYSRREDYSEFWYEAMLLGYLEARYGGFRRRLKVGGGLVDIYQADNRWNRPVPIELAVRTKHTNTLNPSMNQRELKKLVEAPAGCATRYLVLLDTVGPLLTEQKLRNWYTYPAVKELTGQRSVSVLYYHKALAPRPIRVISAPVPKT